MVDNGFLINITSGATDVKLISMYSMHYIILIVFKCSSIILIILNDMVVLIEMNWCLMFVNFCYILSLLWQC